MSSFKGKRFWLRLIGIVVAFLIVSSTLPVFATNYGVGDYSQCPYSVASTNCDISISNTGFTLFLNITPSLSGNCTIQTDQVTVSTYDPNGYTLTLGNEANTSKLIAVNGTSYNVPASSGTLASPVALTDTWGYRVDGTGGFGAGPTSAATNAAPNSSIHFAGVQPSTNTADTIASTSTLNTSVSTTIWYGICLDDNLAVPPGYYSSTVLYTATAN